MNPFLDHLQQECGVLVTVVHGNGSVPREAGAWMGVFPGLVFGTIGGGRLEFDAIREARGRLAEQSHEVVVRYALGPSLGQCCGGIVHLKFTRVCATDVPELQVRLAGHHQPIALFGGGHIAKALVRVLASLPFSVLWVDSRDEIFPSVLPSNVRCEHSDPVEGAMEDVLPDSKVLIMSFSHAEDLEIVSAALKRQRERGDLTYIGLIGSKTKWATFRHRLMARGYSEPELAQITCPIGVRGIAGKEPEVIAVSVAAQLLHEESTMAASAMSVT